MVKSDIDSLLRANVMIHSSLLCSVIFLLQVSIFSKGSIKFHLFFVWSLNPVLICPLSLCGAVLPYVKPKDVTLTFRSPPVLSSYESCDTKTVDSYSISLGHTERERGEAVRQSEVWFHCLKSLFVHFRCGAPFNVFVDQIQPSQIIPYRAELSLFVHPFSSSYPGSRLPSNPETFPG